MHFMFGIGKDLLFRQTINRRGISTCDAAQNFGSNSGPKAFFSVLAAAGAADYRGTMLLVGRSPKNNIPTSEGISERFDAVRLLQPPMPL